MLSSRWFLPSDTQSPPRGRIFCFAPAGGDPRAFLDWQSSLGADAEILAVCLPGRGHRPDERAPASIAELADGVAAAISDFSGQPIYLFGHSSGALVAFEVARRLGNPQAFRHLVASGCAAPSLLPSDYNVWAAGNKGRAFLDESARFLRLPPEFTSADDEVQELLLADLRTDIDLLAGYRYLPAAPLTVGLSLICGRDDPYVERAALESWKRECETAPEYYWLDGDHFFLEQRPAAVIDILRLIVGGFSDNAAPFDEDVEVI